MSDSELRQRRGGEKAPASKEEDERAERMVNEMITRMKSQPKPGLTNEAKAAKDILAADPYNLQSILNLGKAYANDEHWPQCENVLLRGWKRADELGEMERYQLLGILCTASMRCKHYKQALAVLNDMPDPPDQSDSKKMFEVMRCQVYAYNGDQQKSLKAFHQAIDAENFDGAAPMWVACAGGFKKVGILDLTKSVVENLAENEEEKAKLEAMGKIAEMKELIQEPSEPNQAWRYLILFFCIIMFFVFGYALYVMESRSLAQLTGGKPKSSKR